MPPANRQLQWTRIDHFGGMWTAGDKLLMPPNAAQIMSGCHPQPQGGLRAFFKATPDLAIGHDSPGGGSSMLTSPPSGPLTSPSSQPIGIVPLTTFFAGGVPHVIFAWVFSPPVAGFHVAMEQRPDIFTTGPYRLRESGDFAGDTPIMVDAFPVVPVGASSYQNNVLPSVPIIRTATSAVAGSPTTYMAIVPDPTDGGGGNRQGLWSFTPAAGFDNVIEDRRIRSVAIHQNRICLGVGHSVVFSSPGTMDITGAFAQYINLSGGLVVWMLPLPPSDFLVGTTTGAVFNIQGALSDPTVRTLVLPNQGAGYHHVPTMSRFGPVALLDGGPTIIGTDGSYAPLAQSIERSLWQHHGGSLAYLRDVLFAPNWHVLDVGEVDALKTIRRNGAMAYDFATQAWFTTAHPDHADCPNPLDNTVDPVNTFTSVADTEGNFEPYRGTDPKVYVTPTKVTLLGSPKSTKLSYYHDFDGDRAPVYEWMSAPLRAPDGREVDLQEVQVGALAFHTLEGSTLSITATNEYGETVTSNVDMLVAGRGVYTAPLRIKGQYVDVRIKAVNQDGGEAPMLEYVSFGWTPGHLPQDKPAGGYPTAYPGGY